MSDYCLLNLVIVSKLEWPSEVILAMGNLFVLVSWKIQQ